MSKRIIFIAPYPKGQAPSQRFRFEQYLELLQKEGFEIQFHSFLNTRTWNKLYNKGSFFGKVTGLLGSFWRRFILLFKIRRSDYVFIHREASMVGPPVFEWIIAKILRKKYIYDFDDAIWLPNYSESNEKFHKLKAYGKVKRIIKWADSVTAGNNFLKRYAEQYNNNVQVLPTTIDLDNVHNICTIQDDTNINIGWTGSHTTLGYLTEIVPILAELEKEYRFTFTVISNQKPNIKLNSLHYIPWKKETEIEDLSKINIGLMPLKDNPWAEGKCGFKGLQYMALEIPAVISSVGVNKEIVDHNINGILCTSDKEWKEALTKLITNRALREDIGKKGRETVLRRYSTSANKEIYLNLFE
jgi:glycosyltransferase involved in cell wall biosynthesis